MELWSFASRSFVVNAVLMAWYGVNFVLGTGLHSYGFGTGGSELFIATFVGVDLLLVAITAAKHQGWLASKQLVKGENRRLLQRGATSNNL